LRFLGLKHFKSNCTALLCIVLAVNDNFVCDARFVGETLGNKYGRGTGTILLSDLQCTGSETFIGDCPHNGWGSHDCTHYEDVSIICTITLLTSPPSPARHGTRFTLINNAMFLSVATA